MLTRDELLNIRTTIDRHFDEHLPGVLRNCPNLAALSYVSYLVAAFSKFEAKQRDAVGWHIAIFSLYWNLAAPRLVRLLREMCVAEISYSLKARDNGLLCLPIKMEVELHDCSEPERIAPKIPFDRPDGRNDVKLASDGQGSPPSDDETTTEASLQLYTAMIGGAEFEADLVRAAVIAARGVAITLAPQSDASRGVKDTKDQRL